MKTLHYPTFLVFSLFICHAQAQQAVLSAGGDTSSASGSISFSIGQIDYIQIENTSGNVHMGVQQPFEIYTVEIDEKLAPKYSITLFPNPTTENLTLQISNYNNEFLSYQLYDLQGKLLSNGQITSHQTIISLSSLPTATYFVQIIDKEKQKVQSFKIIKTQ